MNDMSQLLDIAMDASRKAGDAILEIYKQEFDVEEKQDGSPITEADVQANELIRTELLKTGIPVLSEESPDSPERLNSSQLWIVDPIDGTSGFVDKGGDFSVMIGLIEDHKPIIGVVYRPVKEVMYFAEFGKGSYKMTADGIIERIRVSDRTNLADLRLITSKHHLSDEVRNIITSLNIGGVVRIGSIGIKAGYIAENRGDAYFSTTTAMGEWDLCAPHCIINEAGGKMTGLKGEEIKYNKMDILNPHGILVTNGVCHDTMLELIDEYKKNSWAKVHNLKK